MAVAVSPVAGMAADSMATRPDAAAAMVVAGAMAEAGAMVGAVAMVVVGAVTAVGAAAVIADRPGPNGPRGLSSFRL
jgi:hypothetical protein